MFKVRSDTANLPFTVLYISKIFANHGLQTWLCYGALLGIIRENRLLPWNNDVELGLVCHKLWLSTVQSLLSDLSSAGFLSTYYSTSRSFSFRHPYLAIQVNVNIFLVDGEYLTRPHDMCSQPDNGSPFFSQALFWAFTLFGSRVSFKIKDLSSVHIVRSIRFLLTYLVQLLPRSFRLFLSYLFYQLLNFLGPSSSTKTIPHTYVLPLQTLDFYSGSIYSPCQPESLLRYLYGDDWRIPKDNWSFYSKANQSQSYVEYLPVRPDILAWYL